MEDTIFWNVQLKLHSTTYRIHGEHFKNTIVREYRIMYVRAHIFKNTRWRNNRCVIKYWRWLPAVTKHRTKKTEVTTFFRDGIANASVSATNTSYLTPHFGCCNTNWAQEDGEHGGGRMLTIWVVEGWANFLHRFFNNRKKKSIKRGKKPDISTIRGNTKLSICTHKLFLERYSLINFIDVSW